MYAVIETGGRQYRVELGSEIVLDQLDAEPGSTIELGRVLLVADGEDAHIGQPVVDDARVTVDVLRHGRGDKIVVFKYQPKARRRVKQGHRSDLTIVRVADIVLGERSAARDAQAQAEKEAAARATAEEEAARKAAADQELAAKLAAAEQTAAEQAEETAESEASRKPAARKGAAKKAAAEQEQAAPTDDEPAADKPAKTATKPRTKETAKASTKETAKASTKAAADEKATAKKPAAKKSAAAKGSDTTTKRDRKDE